MKKICILLLIVLTVAFFTSCSNAGNNTDNVKNAEIVNIESNFYSNEEIQDAIDVVESEFRGFTGCTLTKIGYIGDDEMTDYLPDDVDDVTTYIVLDCEFTTSASSVKEGFNANDTYKYGLWKWYLSKDDSGSWKIDNYGVA